ncbi:hypothetical protein PPERSA_07704 [Pseudocohnilembus persalinus]|uniref:RING-type E3 ubiquitin transferase n=1 Tax=Pseudocohnilembus persalinus TaxID=266149 RepID=A0A0V0R1S9_PSEPJ|nr:hypothetical protein PPERSA_07704 [Pseudocohnilembus persalinus]|eukprot:KRX08224.1 hypothetical protein PPERSA_07704 [Pseudocohnilembus persalinus]
MMIDDNMIQDYRQQRARRAYIICIMLFFSISIMNMFGGQEYKKQTSQRISTQNLNDKSYIDLIQLLQLYDPSLNKNLNNIQQSYQTIPFELPSQYLNLNFQKQNSKEDGETKNEEEKKNNKKNTNQINGINDQQDFQINQSNESTQNNKTYQNPFLSQYEKYMTDQQKQQYQINLEFLKKTMKIQKLTHDDIIYYLFKKLSQQNLVGKWEYKENSQLEDNYSFPNNDFKFKNQQGLQNIEVQQVLGQQKLEVTFETYDGNYIDLDRLQFQLDITPNLNTKHTQTENFDFNFNTKNFPFYFEKEYPQLGIGIECQANNFKIQIIVDKIGKADFWKQAISYSLLIAFLALLQLYGILKVLKNIINNPQDSARYSLEAISAVFIWDGMFAGSHILFSIKNFDIFQYLMPPSVLFMVLWVIFERILMLQIWKLNNHAILENETLFRKQLMVFHLKIYFIMCVLIILGQYVIFIDFLFISINLITLFQIFNIAYKGQQQRIDQHFIWCVILPRSIIPLYLRGCPYNIFHLEPSFFVTFSILVLIFLQVLVLYAQQYLGPRFFIPDILQPNKFNYFMKIPQMNDIEQGIDQEFAEDCTICFTPLYQQPGIDMNSDNSQNNQFYRRLRRKKNQIMRTPCNHKFHIICLSNWMNIKMECPSCRSKLPPI